MTSQSSAPATERWVYFGTYTEKLPHVNGVAEGIYRAKFDSNTGALRVLGVTSGIANPSFLALHPTLPVLYAVSEASRSGGEIVAFALDRETGALTELNRQSTYGSSPCHVSVEAAGQFAFAANYVTGNVCLYPLAANGELLPASDVVQHRGSGVNTSRQEGPHAHSVTIDRHNKHVIAADLGLDRLFVYGWDATTKKLVLKGTGATPDGAGPRHIAYHPKFVYAINELDSTMSVFRYHAERGALDLVETVSTVPADFSGVSYCADVHLSASGQFLYGSNRGHDSIVTFAVDEASGKLTTLGYTSTQGSFPRNFAIDPSGQFLLAANQNSSNVAVYRIDATSGLPAPTGAVFDVPTPVCVLFV
ncbi:MAG: lactonase family protein [Anaerolineae bacterium]|nr:lactonase family protein [Anaerolineae bacterium]